MKKSLTIIFFNLLFLTHVLAQSSKVVPVWDRNAKGKLKEVTAEIVGLLDESYAETKEFKIVEGRSDTPVKLDDSDLGKKAANVLHHLLIAHSYFANDLGSVYVRNLNQIIVRIEMTDTFMGDFHWANSKFSNNYNNAETIPPSNRSKAVGIKSWDNEIWFRPTKDVKVKSDTERAGAMLDASGTKNATTMAYVERSVTNSLSDVLARGNAEYVGFELQYLLGMVAFIELMPKGMEYIGKTYKKTISLDTAMIPEIIYHEFSHVALYDHLEFDEKTPVVEGLANYFASKILGSNKLGYKLNKFGKNLGGYSGKSKLNYKYENEIKENSHSSFLLSLFTSLDQNFENFDKTLFEARVDLTKNSDIKYDLVKVLGDSISKENNKAEGLKLRRVLLDFGL